MKKNKTIHLVLPTGIAVRNALQSSLRRALEVSKYKLNIIIHTHPNLINLEDKLYEGVEIRPFISKRRSLIYKTLYIVCQQRFHYVHETTTTRILRKQPFSDSLYGKIKYMLAYPFPRSEFLYLFFLKIFTKYFCNDDEIDSIKKNDIVILNHITSDSEINYSSRAKQVGAKLIGVVRSFDNITSKGFMPIRADKLLVWNNMMKKEAKMTYGYEENKIAVIGIPQFDNYKKSERITTGKKIEILYAAQEIKVYPDDIPVVLELGRKLDKNRFNLSVRLNPMDDYDRWIEVSKEINILYPSNKYKDFHNRFASDDFICELGEQLGSSDIVINTYSTMALDALAFDKLVINIDFDYTLRKKSVTRFRNFDHYIPIINSGAIISIKSVDQIIDIIENFDRIKLETCQQRSALKDIYFGPFDGNSGYRILSESIK